MGCRNCPILAISCRCDVSPMPGSAGWVAGRWSLTGVVVGPDRAGRWRLRRPRCAGRRRIRRRPHRPRVGRLLRRPLSTRRRWGLLPVPVRLGILRVLGVLRRPGLAGAAYGPHDQPDDCADEQQSSQHVTHGTARMRVGGQFQCEQSYRQRATPRWCPAERRSSEVEHMAWQPVVIQASGNSVLLASMSAR